MLLRIVSTSQFRKDYKRAKRRAMAMDELQKVLAALANGQVLPSGYNDHALTGNYVGFRECHIRPDWLLIYMVDNKNLILTSSRTGSHTDLFD